MSNNNCEQSDNGASDNNEILDKTLSITNTRVVSKVMSNFFCMLTGNSRRRRMR